MDVNSIYNFVLDNLKHFMFPEELIKIDLEMSKQEIIFIFVVKKNNEITMSKLSDIMNSSMSTLTGIADRLVKKKYICRKRSNTDRRIVLIKLTEKGNEFVESFNGKIMDYISIAMNAITDEEKMFLINIITKIFNAVKLKPENKEIDMNDGEKVKKILID